MMAKQTTLRLELAATIRPAIASDMRKLEWYGKHSRFREILESDFARAEAGELAYLVAVVNDFPVGQIEVDLVKHQDEAIGQITALRVLDPFQRCGVATKLMESAENTMRQHQLKTAQLAVDKTNEQALKLYEKRGYEIVGEDTETWGYTDLDGTYHHVSDDEWKMQKNL